MGSQAASPRPITKNKVPCSRAVFCFISHSSRKLHLTANGNRRVHAHCAQVIPLLCGDNHASRGFYGSAKLRARSWLSAGTLPVLRLLAWNESFGDRSQVVSVAIVSDLASAEPLNLDYQIPLAFMHHLDTVAIRVEHIGGVIARMLFKPDTRRYIILRPGCHRCLVERVHDFGTFRDKREMNDIRSRITTFEPVEVIYHEFQSSFLPPLLTATGCRRVQMQRGKGIASGLCLLHQLLLFDYTHFIRQHRSATRFRSRETA